MRWRIVACVALVLAAASLLVAVWLFSEIQEERREVVTQNCRANNNQNAVLSQLLDASAAEREREHRPVSPAGRVALDRATRALRPVPCDRLPVEQPVPWK